MTPTATRTSEPSSAHVLPEDRWNYFHYDGRQTRYCIEDSQGRKYYYWDGLRLMERYNATTETARTFTHGPSPLAGIANMVDYTEGGQTHDFHYDIRGTVTSLTDGAGDVAQTYEHDAWGVRLSATGELENPIQYQGCAWLKAPDLTTTFISPSRLYAGQVGRFQSKDIVRAGNRYSVSFGPNWADPSGLWKLVFRGLSPRETFGYGLAAAAISAASPAVGSLLLLALTWTDEKKAAVSQAFGDVQAGLPPVIERVVDLVSKANDLPDACPYKVYLLHNLGILQSRLGRMLADLTDQDKSMKLELAFLDERDAQAVFGFFTGRFKHIDLDAVDFFAADRDDRALYIFHELYHVAGCPAERKAVSDIVDWADHAPHVEVVWKKKQLWLGRALLRMAKDSDDAKNHTCQEDAHCCPSPDWPNNPSHGVPSTHPTKHPPGLRWHRPDRDRAESGSCSVHGRE